MARVTTKTNKRKVAMSKWDLEANTVAVHNVVLNRQECTTFESALSYIQDRLKEMEKSGEWPWIQELTKADGSKGTFVVANLKSMPIYWKDQDAGGAVDILNPDGTIREKRNIKVNNSRFEVSNAEQGKEFIRDLASGQDEALNARVRAASEAYADVVNVELPAIAEKAEMIYKDLKKDQEFGAWGEGDEKGASGRMRISKAKTYAMNTCKQKARRQLGYDRWAETIRVTKK